MIFEGVGGRWSVDGAQSNDTNLDATGESVNMGEFLFGKKFSLISFWP